MSTIGKILIPAEESVYCISIGSDAYPGPGGIERYLAGKTEKQVISNFRRSTKPRNIGNMRLIDYDSSEWGDILFGVNYIWYFDNSQNEWNYVRSTNDAMDVLRSLSKRTMMEGISGMENPRWFRTRNGPVAINESEQLKEATIENPRWDRPHKVLNGNEDHEQMTFEKSGNIKVVVKIGDLEDFANTIMKKTINGENSGTEYGYELRKYINDFIQEAASQTAMGPDSLK